MAEYLAAIFGTEKDKVNCSFYFKISACHHIDRCSRNHNKPTFSQYGEIEEMNVCDNLGDHLVGNVYIKLHSVLIYIFLTILFRREEHAEAAVNSLNNRWFGGRPIIAELGPVTDFREACCHQYKLGECKRSGFCNFMHLKPISQQLRKFLYGHRLPRHHSREHVGTRRTRSPSPRHGHHHSNGGGRRD
ncbi:splicing factor U2af 38 kDa subunit [Aphis craccivora]|uniref:Splicing factor U2af 38 kDa subunit n=1 Tax=Aphis craccivora TaxID=307492 RepID=A0A6G0Z5G8_APHCR|nr:splicing factor U2af 38 kDa subunit [Aphis craccivora]